MAAVSRMHASDLNGGGSSSHGGERAALPHPDELLRRRERRGSPSYDSWRPRDEENGGPRIRRMTPERALADQGYSGPSHRHQNGDDRDRRGGGGGGFSRGPRGGAGNESFLAERRAQREASNFSIWPASPRTPRTYDDSDDDERSRKRRRKDKKSKKSSSSKHHHRSSKHKSSSRKKRRDSDSEDSDGDSSDEEDSRSRRKHRKSSDKKRKHRHDDGDSEEESQSGSDDDRRSRRRSHDKRDRSSAKHRHSRSRTPDRVHNEQEDEWAEKTDSGQAGRPTSGPAVGEPSLAVTAAPADRSGDTSSKGKSKETGVVATRDVGAGDDDDDDDDDVGPKPYMSQEERLRQKDFGGALLRGEGEAMAAYVTEGKRIPRRGEIGLESSQIEAYEKAGFVMSGSRHRRMNAVRMRKENQIISAEEKRGILKLQKEEQAKKESMIVGSFKELVERRLASERQGPRRYEDD